MTREMLLANSDSCMTNFWILLSLMMVLAVMVMLPANMSAARLQKLKDTEAVPYEEDLRKIAVMNRYVLVLSVIAILGLGILYTYHPMLLPLPMDELRVFFNSSGISGYEDMLWPLFKPLILFLLMLFNVMLIIIHTVVRYRQYTFKAVAKLLYKDKK